MSPTSTPAVDVVALAHSYRRLVLWVGAQIGLSVIHAIVTVVYGVSVAGEGSEQSQLVVGLLILSLFLAIGVAQVVYGYQTARALGSTAPIVWAIAIFFPCLNVIILLILSARATQACRDRGVRVGFLGPDLDAARHQGRQGMAGTSGEPESGLR